MAILNSVFQFFYGGTLKYVLFIFLLGAFAAAGIVFVSYPWQCIIGGIIVVVTYCLFVFCDELDFS